MGYHLCVSWDSLRPARECAQRRKGELLESPVLGFTDFPNPLSVQGMYSVTATNKANSQFGSEHAIDHRRPTRARGRLGSEGNLTPKGRFLLEQLAQLGPDKDQNSKCMARNGEQLIGDNIGVAHNQTSCMEAGRGLVRPHERGRGSATKTGKCQSGELTSWMATRTDRVEQEKGRYEADTRGWRWNGEVLTVERTNTRSEMEGDVWC